MKLVEIFKQPPDPDHFEQAYMDEHLTLLRKVPGLDRIVLTRFTESMVGETLFLMAEIYFTSESALRRALKSPEMAKVSRDLDRYQGLVTLLYGEERDQPFPRRSSPH